MGTFVCVYDPTLDSHTYTLYKYKHIQIHDNARRTCGSGSTRRDWSMSSCFWRREAASTVPVFSSKFWCVVVVSGWGWGLLYLCAHI